MIRIRVSLIIAGFFIVSPIWAGKVFTICKNQTCQTIHGFGAADAWSNEVIGFWNDEQRNRAADWLFSKELTPDGKYQGIGLSIWRYNLGAGSSEQLDSSLIGDPYRRTECFLNKDGTFDFGKQAGAQWMIRAAKDRGLETLVMFSNSPPVSITKNGKAFAGTCHESNLDPSQYNAFAGYLAKSLKYFDNQNIRFDYVSPVNEPEWGWCQKDGQEGNPYTNVQIADLTRKINTELVKNQLNTRIQIPESGLLVFANPGYKFKPGRQNEINSFFKPAKDTYVGDQSQVAPLVCAHSYFTEWPLWIARKVRQRTSRVCEKRNLDYWMSEYCILKTTKEITGGGRDLGMHTALYVSRVIHHDLVDGNASAWCWWLGISTADYKDGLVYTNRDGSGLTDSKTLWALGNFSQFIHPGSVRIAVKGKADKELMVSAYRNKGTCDLVIVIINMKPEKQSIRLKGLTPGTVSAWETSETRNLGKLDIISSADELEVSAKSITTLIVKQ